MLAKSSYVSMIVFAAALIGLSTHAICAFLITGRSLNTDGSMQCEKVISISRIANLVLICGTLIVLCILLLNSIFLSKAHSADSSKSQRFIIRAVTIINIMIATFYHLAWISSFVFWIWSFFMFKADTDEQCQSLNNQSLQTMTTFRCMWSPDSCNKRDVYKFYQILLIMCAASSALMFFSSVSSFKCKLVSLLYIFF
ncbi:hypothetical protein ACOME3_007888 [Neoechinorhynchus agilis]